MALSTYNRSRKLDPQPEAEPDLPKTKATIDLPEAKPERPLHIRGKVQGKDLRAAINAARAKK
jgi:hypothetical protein